MRAIIFGALALALASPAGLAAQIYKWVDEQGVTHFDAQPPAGQNVTQVDAAKPVPAPAQVPPKAPSVNQGKVAQQAADRQVRQQVQDQEEKMAAFCDTSRKNLAQLQNNPRVRQNMGGELRRLTEEERQAKITLTQKQIDENCQ